MFWKCFLCKCGELTRLLVVLCHIAEFVGQFTPMKPIRIRLRRSFFGRLWDFTMGIRCDLPSKEQRSCSCWPQHPVSPPFLFHGRNAFRLFIGERAKGLLTFSCILIDSEAHVFCYSLGNNSPTPYTSYVDLPLV